MAHHTFASILLVAGASGLITTIPRASCTKEVGVAQRTIAPASATIHFDRDDVDVTFDALASLDAIIDRVWSDLGARVLVVGFANERRSLLENLELAELRARFVAEHLTSRGVSQRQVVVVAREAAPDDPAGSRCDVDVIRTSPAAVALKAPSDRS